MSESQKKRQSLLPHRPKGEARKEYVAKNYEKILMYNRNRRIRKFSNGGEHTLDE
jgi:hypothetical protein